MKSQQSIWDREYGLDSAKWNRETLTLPPILKDKVVLELGAGNGKTLRAIVKQRPKRIEAIDFSMVTIANLKKETFEVPVSCTQAELTALPFQKETFDIIICYYVLNNLSSSELKKATVEMQRVLKTNGIVVFEDFAAGDYREQGKRLGKHTVQKGNGLTCHFFTLAEVRSLFKGFSTIEAKENSFSRLLNKTRVQRRIISATIKK